MSDVKRILVPVSEASRMLGIGPTKTYELINSKALVRVHLGSKSLITMESIERLAEDLLKQTQVNPTDIDTPVQSGSQED